MNRVTWQYVAGFFDGEGCVGAPSGRTGIKLQIAQKTAAVLEEIKSFLDAQGIVCAISRNRSHPAQMYTLHIDGRAAARLMLEGLRPYVIVKKQSVEDALRQLRLFPPLTRFASTIAWEARHWSNRDVAVGGRL
jgi:hypothetical protein